MMRRTKFALASLIVAVSPGLTAQAGLLPPSVWEATSLPSVEVLAMRDTLQTAVLAAAKASGGLTKAEIKALVAFYEARQYQPVWFSGTTTKPGAQAIVDMFNNAGAHALRPADYAFASEALANLSNASGRLEQAGAEAALSAAALLYARHATAGRINPSILGRMVTQKPVAADPMMVLSGLASSQNPAAYLEGLQPSGVEYKTLRTAYLALQSKTLADWTPIPGGKSIKPGARDPRVAALRQRLTVTGDYTAAAPLTADSEDVYSETLVAAVKTFQARSNLPAEGIVGKMTLGALNYSPDYRRKQLAINMERRRWLPDIKDRGVRHVLVNQPEYKVRLFDDNEEVYVSKVVIGRKKFQTAEFTNSIKFLVFNPYWNVPRSIATREFLPNIKSDPTVMARKGFEMFQGGRIVNPATVNWSEVSKRGFRFNFRQPPGRSNALGRVKFMFPNQHAIYLHDTPSRSLFNRVARTFSHGCVRVHKPMEFAQILLERDGWTRARINAAVKGGRNQRINLSKKVPIYLTYWTAWVDQTGAIRYAADMYDRDKKLIRAMDLDNSALKLAKLSDN